MILHTDILKKKEKNQAKYVEWIEISAVESVSL